MRDGWLGVDVFFVLSGWLITGLLLDDAEREGRIRFTRFYLRRAARLYPALIVAVVLALALRGVNVRDATIALAYVSDFSRALNHDIGSLGHTWSLAIEEHFYLAWPPVLLAAWRWRGRGGVAAVAGTGVTLSLAALLATGPLGNFGIRGYNLPVTRGWELLAGCFLAAAFPHQRFGRRTRLLAGTVAPVILVLAVIVSGHFVGLWRPVTLIPVVALTCGLLLAAQSGGCRWLARWPLPYLGRISYGIYLFHYPVALAVYNLPWTVRVTATAAGATFLAALSWQVIERPVMRWVRDQSARAAGAVLGSSRDLHGGAEVAGCLPRQPTAAGTGGDRVTPLPRVRRPRGEASDPDRGGLAHRR